MSFPRPPPSGPVRPPTPPRKHCRWLVLLGLALASVATAAEETPLRRVRVGSFPYFPAIAQNETGSVVGFYVDFLESVARREGWQLDYRHGSWAEGLERARQGQLDLLTSVARTPERSEFLDFGSEPLLTVWGELFVRDNSPLNRVTDMAGRKVGVMADDFNGQSFQQLAHQLRLQCDYVVYKDFDAIGAALERREIEGGILNNVYGAWAEERFQIRATGAVFSPFDIYFAAPRGASRDVLATLDRHLAEARTNRHSPMQEARRKWLGQRVESVEVLPRWLDSVLLGLGGLAVVSCGFVLLLRRQVRHATRTLADREARLAAIVQTAPVGIGFAVSRVWVEANEAVCRMTGYRREELLGQDSRLLYPDREEYDRVGREVRQQISERRRAVVETRWRHCDGHLVHILLHVARLDLENEDRGGCFVVLDITEQKRIQQEQLEMERRLFQAQKLESLGVLAGGIAHDFNNLLTAIVGNLDLAAMDLQPDAPAQEPLGEAQKASRKAADLVRQMLAYSGRGRFQVRAVDLGHLAREMTQLLEASILKGVEVELDLAADLPLIQADPAQVQQVILNLLTNAAEAVAPRCGKIRLRTGRRECDEGLLATSRQQPVPPAGRYIFVEVVDNGCGMDRTVRERLFEPFFSTKFTGRGLGMPAVLGVMVGHRGAITVESEVGQGTIITVFFPECSAARPQTPVEQRPVPESTANRREITVLVVDDEEPVRQLVERSLARAGHRVLLAADGEEAIARLQKDGAEVDCVLLDLTMPRMNGIETWNRLREMRPGLPVILASGYDETELQQRYSGLGFAGFLQKPFEVSALERCLRQVCAPPPGPTDRPVGVASGLLAATETGELGRA